VVLVLGLASACASTASAREILYGAGTEGIGGSPSTLYELDPSTGAPVETIGEVGFNVTGMAIDPADGTLYGSTGRQPAGGAPNPGSLITINRETGAGTLVGDLVPGTDTAGDITFAADGSLYGWMLPAPTTNDLATINKATGAATVVGEAGGLSGGGGLAFSPGGVLFHTALDDGPLYTVNPATGAVTPVAPLSGTAGVQLAALAFDAAGTLFAARVDYNNTNPAASEVVTIETATGQITPRGPSVNRLDAIEFGEVPDLRAPRTISFDATKAKPKAGARPRLGVRKGKKVLLSGDVGAPQNVAGCESAQTVELQRKKKGEAGFTTFTQVQTDAGGAFSLRQKVKKTYEYRALLSESAACAGATSASEKVKAKRKRKKKK
jgi:hypothetical protein